MRTVVLLLLLPLATVACAPGGAILSHYNLDQGYGAGQFSYAGSGRDFRVDVVGNPFGGDDAAFGRTVTDAMQDRHFGPRTNFTTTPGESARSAYRVVMLFDPPVTFNGMRLCGESPTALPTEAGHDDVSVYAAFCLGNYSLSRVKGTIGGASGPADPAFRELVGQVTFALFPPDRQFDRDDDCPPFIRC